MKSAFPALGLFIALCLGAEGLGALATFSAVRTWYPTLAKPPWTPPGWLFGPVWTVLYLAMAVAAWLVWRRAGPGAVGAALTIFAVQLALNIAWSFLFFGLRNPVAGLVDIVLLWVAVVATTVVFWKISPVAGWLLVPYIAWVTFATALNAAIVRLN
ncbi:MAG: TspO/MBR family protein [Thermoanaerobaculia bacterium]